MNPDMNFVAGNRDIPPVKQVALGSPYERRKDLEAYIAAKVGLPHNQVEVHAASDRTRAAQNMIANVTSRSKKPPRVLWSILHGHGILVTIKLIPPEDCMERICREYNASPPVDTLPRGLIMPTRFFRYRKALACDVLKLLVRSTKCSEWELFRKEVEEYLKKTFAKIADGLHGDLSELNTTVFCLWGNSDEPALDLSSDFLIDYYEDMPTIENAFVCEDKPGLILASAILVSAEMQKVLEGVPGDLRNLEGREYSLEILLKKIEAFMRTHREVYERRHEITSIYTRGRKMVFRFA